MDCPSWLKGGIIGFLIYVLLLSALLSLDKIDSFVSCPITCISDKIFLPLERCSYVWDDINLIIPGCLEKLNLIIYSILGIIYFTAGAIISLVWKKISKREIRLLQAIAVWTLLIFAIFLSGWIERLIAQKTIEPSFESGLVWIPYHNRASHGEKVNFPIAIFNGFPDDKQFKLSFKYRGAYDNMSNPILAADDPNNWLNLPGLNTSIPERFFVEKIPTNQYKRLTLQVKPGKEKPGSYIFDLNITYLNSSQYIPYDNIYKLYVTIK